MGNTTLAIEQRHRRLDDGDQGQRGPRGTKR